MENSKCVIKREAIIIKWNEHVQTATLRIQMKQIDVPLGKLADGLKIGDSVQWTGQNWVLSHIDFE